MMRPRPTQGAALTMLLVVVLLLTPAPVLGFLVRAPLSQTGRSVLTSSPPASAFVVPMVLPQRQRVVVRQSTVPDGSDGMPPMPMGGESVYEYESEYPDQQAEMEYLADDELLAKYRADMQNSQDQWQLNLFLKAQTGIWSGVWSEYTPVPNGGANGETVLRMTNIHKGRQECVGDDEARTVSWRDLTLLHAADGGPLEPVVVAEHTMVPPMFRGGVGSMAADNVFSRSSVQAKEGGKEGEEVFEAETWIRQGNYRTRVSFVYESKGPMEAFEAHKVVVKKERLGKQGPTAEEPELFGSSGRGIYDTSARVPGSWELSLHGGLSLAFPPSLPRGEKGAVIVDWTAGYMRFQADRLFDLPDGTLGSLEVTQIGTEDSMKFKLEEEEAGKGAAAGLESAAAAAAAAAAGEGGGADEP